MDADAVTLGPSSPMTSTPRRLPGSERRTSNIDTVRPDESNPTRVVEGRARDTSTDLEGISEVVGAVQLWAEVDGSTYELRSIALDPVDPRVDALIGATVASGFRRRLAETMTAPEDERSLARLLLDDLTGAQLVAGYETVQRRSDDRAGPSLIAVADLSSRADLCAGWVSGGSLLEGIRRTSEVPHPVGPLAPRLESGDEHDGWHAMADLPPTGMRRARRLDLLAADSEVHPFEAHFRDSHMSEEGHETILHEYRVTGTVDAADRTLLTVVPEALVLPYLECPNALASALQVVGWSLDDLRGAVHRELVGTSACTHLNDTLRSLCDLGALLDRQAAADQRRRSSR